MRAVFILVVCLCTTNAVTEGSTTTASPMSCTMDGTITYTGVPDWVQTVASDCGQANLDNSKTIVITNCTMGSPIHLIMYSTESAPGPETKFVTDNGHQMDFISLTCNALSSPKVYTVRLHSQIGSTQNPLSAMESIILEMQLTDTSGSPATTVKIGQKYTLHVSGAGIHFMKIKTCEAAATQSMSSPVTIYDAATTNANEIGILADITNATKHSADTHPIMASLTGFRLVTSNIVFLSCQIEVCVTDCTEHVKRKRIKSQLKTASIKFEVKDKLMERSTNGAKGLFSTGKQIVTIAMVVVTTYLFH